MALQAHVAGVQRLPAELLVQIFHQVVLDDTNTRRPSILDIRAVCRLWRDASRDTALWTKVRLDMNASGIKAYFRNSGDRLVSAVLPASHSGLVSPNDILSEAIELLSSHASRLTAIDVVSSPPNVTRILSMISDRQARHLCNLRLVSYSSSGHSAIYGAHFAGGNDPIFDHLPNLDTLSLKGVDILGTYQSIKGLTRLRLDRVRVTFQDVLSISKGCPNLRRFHLNHLTRHSAPPSTEELQQHITFGQLDFLQLITTNRDALATCLLRITVPQECNVTLRMPPPTLEANFSFLLPTGSQLGRHFQETSKLYVTMHRSAANSDPEPPYGKIEIYAHKGHPNQMAIAYPLTLHSVAFLVSQIGATLCARCLTSICIDIKSSTGSLELDTDVGEWNAMYSRLFKLEAITLHSHDTFLRDFDPFMAILPPGDLPVDKFLPLLRSVHLRDINIVEEDMGAIEEVMRGRVERGYSPLERLELTMTGSTFIREDSEGFVRALDRLRSFVEIVTIK